MRHGHRTALAETSAGGGGTEDRGEGAVTEEVPPHLKGEAVLAAKWLVPKAPLCGLGLTVETHHVPATRAQVGR
jgi:hypothetical protein